MQLTVFPLYEEAPGVTPDVARARLSALQLNEKRLELEREALVVMRLCVQAELARLSRYAS